MSPNKLATQLLAYSSTTSLLLPGALTSAIGSEGVQEALSRNWIRPDTDTGFLVLTDQQSIINDMRELSGKAEEAPPPPTPQPSSESRRAVLAHSHRLHEDFGIGPVGGDSGAPQTGQPARPAQPNVMPTTPAPNKPGQDYIVGEDVLVADEGKSYQAKVQAANPDGTYKLSFGPNRPSQQDRMFRREELQKVQPEREGTVRIQQ